MRVVVDRLSRALDLPVGITRMPRFALRALGVFAPLLREVAEMAYPWDAPYVVDDSRFRAAFGGAPTPVDEVVRETAMWAQQTYSGTARAA
jgi:hypothetical protein